MGLAGAVAMCVLLGFVSNVLAEDANQPKEAGKEKQTHVIGTVKEVKDQNGIVTEVTVKGPRETYQVTLDAKGKELGSTMDGKKVKAVGTVEVKDGVKWLTVEKFSEEQAKPESKPHKDKPAGKPYKNK